MVFMQTIYSSDTDSVGRSKLGFNATRDNFIGIIYAKKFATISIDGMLIRLRLPAAAEDSYHFIIACRFGMNSP
jgi:hypothetical protein